MTPSEIDLQRTSKATADALTNFDRAHNSVTLVYGCAALEKDEIGYDECYKTESGETYSLPPGAPVYLIHLLPGLAQTAPGMESPVRLYAMLTDVPALLVILSKQYPNQQVYIAGFSDPKIAQLGARYLGMRLLSVNRYPSRLKAFLHNTKQTEIQGVIGSLDQIIDTLSTQKDSLQKIIQRLERQLPKNWRQQVTNLLLESNK